VKGERAALSYESSRLTYLTAALAKPQAGELVGGNLSLWASLMGTKLQPSVRGKFLFLEDLSEPFYRIDRMFTQVAQAGGLDGCVGLILGDFTDCKDEAHHVLKPPASADERERRRRDRKSGERIPLRKVYEQREAFAIIFADVGTRLGIPVATGLPVGHGPNFAPLPLGAQYELTPDGSLELREWDWLDRSKST
jgi:muramoyltetrapeptide carboxypeptidase LdcA involved in peptidoglycan recycling